MGIYFSYISKLHVVWCKMIRIVLKRVIDSNKRAIFRTRVLILKLSISLSFTSGVICDGNGRIIHNASSSHYTLTNCLNLNFPKKTIQKVKKSFSLYANLIKISYVKSLIACI